MSTVETADSDAGDEEILGEVERRGGRRPVLYGALAVSAVLAVLVAVLVGAGQPDPKSVVVGKPAPSSDREFDTLDGRRLSVGSLKGQYVFLNFFASWCVPCEQEHPQLVRFQQRHAPAGDATVLQVIFSDAPERARAFFAREGGPDWPVLVDPVGQFALDYGVRGPPETFLLDPAGNVLVNIKGAVDTLGMEDLLLRAKEGRR